MICSETILNYKVISNKNLNIEKQIAEIIYMKLRDLAHDAIRLS